MSDTDCAARSWFNRLPTPPSSRRSAVLEMGAGRLEGAQVDLDLPLGGDDRQVGRRGGQPDLPPGLQRVLVGDVDLV